MKFDLFNVPRIVFGSGAIARLAELLPTFGREPLVIYNGNPTRIYELLSQANLSAVGKHQRGEPTIKDIDCALGLARENNCDFVIALGGGSAIDAGKAVAGLLSNGGVATDYMEVVGKGQKIIKPAVPWIAIPTTAGTGAEVTRNAVIGWPEKKFKASLRSELLMATVALIDPELGVDVPPDVTARTGMDALCQCIEAYVSNGANPMTDVIAIKGVELASRHLKRAFDNGHDLEAREAMALAALLGGIALTNAGLGAVHGFAAPIGANFPVPHGTVCAVLLPHVIRANTALGNEKAKEKYRRIDACIGGNAAATCMALVRDLRLPSLGSFGMNERDVKPMVQLAKRASSMRYNPVILDDATLADILRAGL
ncbi:MAG: iron-containing alcohol dehydrogenase [Tepidisphaeraceae bacterium]